MLQIRSSYLHILTLSVVCLVMCLTCTVAAKSKKDKLINWLPDEIVGLTPGQLADPCVSWLPLDSTEKGFLPEDNAGVWLKLRLDEHGKVLEARLVFADDSCMKCGDIALAAIRSRQFARTSMGGTKPLEWAYHKVIFSENAAEMTALPHEFRNGYTYKACDAPPVEKGFSLSPSLYQRVWSYYKWIAGISMLVDQSGKVRMTFVSRPSGHRWLDELLCRDAYDISYMPGQVKGKPVFAWLSSLDGALDKRKVRKAVLHARSEKLPNEIRELSEDQFADPMSTVLPLSQPMDTDTIHTDVSVWLKVRIDKGGMRKSVKVVTCSRPSMGFEQKAMDAFERVQIAPPRIPGHRTAKWLYHEVVFCSEYSQADDSAITPQAPSQRATGELLSTDSSDSNDLPASDEFVPVEQYPEMIYQAPPEYPLAARRTGQTGTVWVKVLVDKAGNVREAMIGKSSGRPLLDKAALDVAIKNRFKPARQSGKPVAVWATYRVDFDLEYIK